MQVTYLGHGALLIKTAGISIVVDPFITPNEKAAGVDVNTLPADYILLTHGHGDHVADVETIADRTGATIVSNFETATYYGAKGYKHHPMNHGGKWVFPFGTLKYVSAIHSSVLPDGTYAGNPGGFVLWNDEACLYIAGDTALTMDMKLIPMTCPPLTAAILPIGDNFTMGYEDAVLAADFISCSSIIGYHYDTFGYIILDKEKASGAFTAAGKTLLLPGIGEYVDL